MKSFLEKYLDGCPWDDSHGVQISAKRHYVGTRTDGTIQFTKTMCPFTDLITIEILIEDDDGEKKITITNEDFNEITKEIGDKMQVNNYQALSSRTLPERPFNENITNCCLGLAGESGEVIEHIKKHVFHGKEIDKQYLLHELGDVLWYVSAIATVAGISLESIMVENVEKLRKRYPNGFKSDESPIFFR